MDPWLLIGWAIIVIFASFLAAFGLGFFKKLMSQYLTDRKRRRAHAGKVGCEGSDVERIYGDERNRVLIDKITHPCKKLATRVTPNGYFCEDHYLENSRRVVSRGNFFGQVGYAHKLNYTLRNFE